MGRDWTKEVLESGEERIVVRAARRSGKTMTAIKWARSAGKRVLFVCPTQPQASMSASMMHTMYSNEIHLTQFNPHSFVFEDGTIVYFVSPRTSDFFRGMSIDAVVLEEVGYMSDNDVLAALVTATTSGKKPKFLATYSEARKTSGLKRLEKIGIEKEITVDYLDLLENGSVTADSVRNMIESLGTKAFHSEFGPFKKPYKMQNKDFIHLLKPSKS